MNKTILYKASNNNLAALFFILILSIGWHQLYSQSILAGQHLSLYYNIFPDTVISYECSGSQNSYSENYYFDVNNDSENDIVIKAYCTLTLGAHEQFIRISSLNANTFSLLGRIDSVYSDFSQSWWTSRVAQQLEFGDTINYVSAEWTNSSSYLLRSFYSVPAGGISIIISDWINEFDRYIGVMYKNLNDTIYGWIRVNCPNAASCTIKEYSFDTALIGIEPYSSNKSILFFPNPFSQSATIDLGANISGLLYVYDIAGNLVRTKQLHEQKTILDKGNLVSGIYFYRIISDYEVISTGKIVVQ